ncbi:inorganic diphosphatase [Olivibacter sp. XZL3]|uniref:inorganic diphosphatase n=1 Tax=Olivibacter sp. XZL3 TaxID=1735116 RepID=UPI001064997F|nr:inorganic diphosphatase [Olivibacter sp. XZL3]
MKIVTAVIETPKGQGLKYDFDPKLGYYLLTKVLPMGLVFPFDFGFIMGTVGEDGDPLDMIVLSELGTFTGCAVNCRVIGCLKADQKERDGAVFRNNRFIGIPEVSVLYRAVQDIADLTPEVKEQLEQFFINYNQQAGKKFKPLEWLPAVRANQLLAQALAEKTRPNKLIQLFLPLYDSNAKPFPEKYYLTLRQELTDRFGGVSIYMHSPVSGIWNDEKGRKEKDMLVVYEVMVDRIEVDFWTSYKKKLAKTFKQDELLIRQMEIGVL